MVEAEQAAQLLGVGLGPLQLVQQLQLPVDQGLEAPAEAEEHVGHAAAQGRLLGRDPHRGRVDGIERPGHLADLVMVGDADGPGLGRQVDRLGPLEPLDHAGQLGVGDLLGRGPQQAERPRSGPDE